MSRTLKKCLIGASLSFVIGSVVLPVLADEAPKAAHTVPAKSLTRSFRYGVCAHLHHEPREGQLKLLDLLDQLGVDTLRDGIEWGSIEPQQGTFNFSKFDELLTDAESKGIDLQAGLAYSTPWGSTSSADAKDWQAQVFAAPQLQPFNIYADAMARRYAGRVKFWEIWNEPEIAFWRSSPAEYTQLFNSASATIAKVDPSAKVMNGGFALEKRPPNMTFLDEFLPAADQSHWDIWAYHDYNTLTESIARSQLDNRYRKSIGAKMPIWINEGGFNTINRGGGEDEQAVALAKKLAVAPSLGVQAYIWYDLYDDGDNPNDKEHHFGLIRRDFTPKPAFYAYQHLIQQLAPCTFDHRLPDSAGLSGVWGLMYKANSPDADNVLVLWREGKDRQTPLWISGGENGTAASVSDMIGKPIDAPRVDGGVLLNVTDVPMYVHLHHSLSPVLKPVLSLPDKLAVLPGEPAVLQINVLNPTSKAQTFSIAAHSDLPEVQAAAPAEPLKLQPGEAKTVSLNVTVPADIATTHSTGIVSAGLRLSGDGPELRASLPYRVAQVIPKVGDASADALADGQGLKLTLTDREHIVNLFTAEPAPKMQWHGTDDLSATANLAWSEEALYIRVNVTDDKHSQPQHAAQIWQSDSLQLAIRCDDSAAMYFECGLALGDDGKTGGWIYSAPPASPVALGVMEKPIASSVQRTGTQTVYQLRLPWKTFGLDKPPSTGLRLNFIANDDDSDGRKGWVQLSDGIGKDKNPNLFSTFVCR